MPTCLAALISNVPGAACTAFPSIVRLTKSAIFVLYQRHLVLLSKRACAVEMGLKLISEFFDERHHGHGSRVAEGAEGAAQHVFRDVVHDRNVALDATAGMEPVEDLLEPRRPFAAGDTPAATLVLVEHHDALHSSDHAGVFIHDNHAARP